MGRPTFPRTLADFQRRFGDETACRSYLAASRWTEGYRCPRCGHAAGFVLPGRGLEVRGEGSGRVRLHTIPDVTGRTLTGFVQASVEPETTVITDGWGGYAGLRALGYRHRPKVQGERDRAKRILPRIHRVFGNLQTWLRGTHHGVDEKNLQPYLDEYVFRFNRRGVPMAAFQTLLGLGSQHRPITHNQLRIRS